MSDLAGHGCNLYIEMITEGVVFAGMEATPSVIISQYSGDFEEVNFNFVFFFKVEPSGRTLILGFSDGVIRVVAADLEQQDEASDPIRLIQAIKPHKCDVSRMSINNGKTILISGSVDRTIFIFRIQRDLPNITLEPIGFIPTPSTVTAFNWKPQSV